MNYFKDKLGQVYYYNDLQIKQGLHEEKLALTAEELEEHLKPSEPVEVREVSLLALKGELRELLVRAKEMVELIEGREERGDAGNGEGAKLGDGSTGGERNTGGVLDGAEEDGTGRGNAAR